MVLTGGFSPHRLGDFAGRASRPAAIDYVTESAHPEASDRAIVLALWLPWAAPAVLGLLAAAKQDFLSTDDDRLLHHRVVIENVQR